MKVSWNYDSQYGNHRYPVNIPNSMEKHSESLWISNPSGYHIHHDEIYFHLVCVCKKSQYQIQWKNIVNASELLRPQQQLRHIHRRVWRFALHRGRGGAQGPAGDGSAAVGHGQRQTVLGVPGNIGRKMGETMEKPWEMWGKYVEHIEKYGKIQGKYFEIWGTYGQIWEKYRQHMGKNMGKYRQHMGKNMGKYKENMETYGKNWGFKKFKQQKLKI